MQFCKIFPGACPWVLPLKYVCDVTRLWQNLAPLGNFLCTPLCKSDMHVRPMRFSISCTQLTAPIKLKWCVLQYCCACLHPNTILMEAGWTTVPCAATNLSILICKSSARTKQSEISVALKTPLEIWLGICIYKTSFQHRPDDYIGFIPSCSPHILQQNYAHGCAHLLWAPKRFVWEWEAITLAQGIQRLRK